MYYQTENTKQAIQQIQRQLRTIQIAEGVKISVPLDGIYGTATETAVKELQQKYGMPVTGVVDRATNDLIREKALIADFSLSEPLDLPVFPKDRVVMRDEISDLVLIIQILLNALTVAYDDFTLFELNGIYDAKMENAVRRFQIRNNIEVSGNVDKRTWNALVTNYEKYRDVSE